MAKMNSTGAAMKFTDEQLDMIKADIDFHETHKNYLHKKNVPEIKHKYEGIVGLVDSIQGSVKYLEEDGFEVIISYPIINGNENKSMINKGFFGLYIKDTNFLPKETPRLRVYSNVDELLEEDEEKDED